MSHMSFVGLDQASPLLSDDAVLETLRSVRTHFGMDIAYLAEIDGDRWTVMSCDAPGFDDVMSPGLSLDATDPNFAKLVGGEFPDLIADTTAEDAPCRPAYLNNFEIGAHISVPIRLFDGTLYGNFCCISRKPNVTLNPRDVSIMQVFACTAERKIQEQEEARQDATAMIERIQAVMKDQSFHMVFQPIYDLQNRAITGFEALCRFDTFPFRSPDMWFNEAAYVGMGVDLEYRVLEATIAYLDLIPDGMTLSVNAGPALVATGRLTKLFAKVDASRLILEVTEQLEINDYLTVLNALNELRALGVKIAVDDTGAGFSGLQQLIQLKPEIIKLDRSLVMDIDTDPAKRTLCAALMHYSQDAGAELVAEGIETQAEADSLTELGVHKAQGWLFAPAMSLQDALQQAEAKMAALAKGPRAGAHLMQT